MLDPPDVGLFYLVPQPSWAVLADWSGRAPAAHVDRCPRSGGRVMDPNEMVVLVVGIAFHDLVAVRHQQAHGERAGEVADHFVDPQARRADLRVSGFAVIERASGVPLSPHAHEGQVARHVAGCGAIVVHD